MRERPTDFGGGSRSPIAQGNRTGSEKLQTTDTIMVAKTNLKVTRYARIVTQTGRLACIEVW
jgi:hypothetical protein